MTFITRVLVPDRFRSTRRRRAKSGWAGVAACAAAFALTFAGVAFAREETQPEPEPTWFEAACKAWDEHAHSELQALISTGRVQGDEARRLAEVGETARFHCADERWEGLLLYASLSRHMRDMRSLD